MPSILDEILGGNIPNLEALRGMQDDSLAAREQSIANGIEGLDELYRDIEDDEDIDARSLRLLIQAARCIMKASHEDILNAAPESGDAARLSPLVRNLTADAIKGCMGMMEEVGQIIEARKIAVAGFKEQLKSPSYAEQREADAAEPTEG